MIKIPRLGRKRQLFAIEWFSLIGLFLLVGILGHDPWKWNETHIFGVIYHYFTTHTWLIPVNADMPFMEKPPLYYWTGVLFCKLFGGWLPLHDAARLASLFYMLLTTFFFWKTTQVLFAAHAQRDTLGWVSVALLLGEIGIVSDAHRMRTDVPLLTGVTITLYGLALLGSMPEHWKKAGAWIGLGMGVAFMSKGLFIPVVLVLAAAALWLAVPALHGKNTWRAWGIATVVALPFVTLWPGLVYLHSPALFMQWFWDNNVGRFLGFSVPKLGSANYRQDFAHYVLETTLPALPLACWGVVVGRRQWRSVEYALPASMLGVGLCLLFISATASRHYLFPLLPCFALLAAPVVMRFSARFMRWWNLSIRILASMAVIYAWMVWLNLRYRPETHLFPWMHFINHWPWLGIVPPDQTFACCVAVLPVLFWLASLRLPLSSPLTTAYTWLAGATMIWITLMTLLLPWRDADRSYRPILMQMVEVARQHPGAHGCIQSGGYDENASPMFQYMVEPLLPPRKEGEPCRFLFVPNTKYNPGAPWSLLWKSAPTSERDVELRLFEAK